MEVDGFVAMRREKAERRRRRRKAFSGGPGWRAIGTAETRWEYSLLGEVLVYWPGPMKWRWQGRVAQGDVFEFIRKREAGDGPDV